MRHVFIALAIATVLCLGTTGCGKEESTAGTGHGQKDEAAEFDDGADKYFREQMECPVCGGKPIKPDFYVDTEKGRIYFDKKECATKFENNRAEYQKKLDKKIEQYMMGGG